MVKVTALPAPMGICRASPTCPWAVSTWRGGCLEVCVQRQLSTLCHRAVTLSEEEAARISVDALVSGVLTP